MKYEAERRAGEACSRAVRIWGADAQWKMVQEECAELIAAINKAIMDSFRNWGSKLSAPIVQGSGRAMPSIQGALPGRADENQPSP